VLGFLKKPVCARSRGIAYSSARFTAG